MRWLMKVFRKRKLQSTMAQLKVAIIGQSPFAAEVYKLLRQNGHQVTGVFTIPDKGNREDALGKGGRFD